MVYLPWSPLPSSFHPQSAPHWSFPQRRNISKQGSSSHLQTADSSPSAVEWERHRVNKVQEQQRWASTCSEYLFCGKTNCKDTHRLPISSIEDEAVLGDQARLGRTLNLQSLTGWHWTPQQGWAIQGHGLRRDMERTIKSLCDILRVSGSALGSFLHCLWDCPHKRQIFCEVL